MAMEEVRVGGQMINGSQGAMLSTGLQGHRKAGLGLESSNLWRVCSVGPGRPIGVTQLLFHDGSIWQPSHCTGELPENTAHLRSVDVKILQQLVAVHEGIEAVKWLLEERSTLTSRCSSLTSSQYSLGEGPDTSLRGSWSSLQDPNDKLDNISIGSYLDTLADDMDEYCPSSSESVLCSTPLGKEVSDRTGGAVGSPLARSEHPKEEQPIWAKLTGEVTKAQEAGRAASTNKDGGQTQLIKSNGFPEKVCRQGAATESARACLSEKLGKTQSPKLKPYKNGKIDLEGCKLNSKMHLEYDAHWRWVQSQDDVTFL
ncbi:hypothetical protein JZ751_024810 [Albula glossodonta]|uniref:Leucine rich adaptor protein 1 n=1 Tax=Albula glossodonta TaxID=121402 RepID=A0A8T2PIE1_9TELE|nr:hypothetical protein JZ751_024810 [Albula glossodonta]